MITVYEVLLDCILESILDSDDSESLMSGEYTYIKKTINSAVSKFKQEVKSVEKLRRNLNQLDGFELALLPLIYLEGFAKLVLNIV